MSRIYKEMVIDGNEVKELTSREVYELRKTNPDVIEINDCLKPYLQNYIGNLSDDEKKIIIEINEKFTKKVNELFEKLNEEKSIALNEANSALQPIIDAREKAEAAKYNNTTKIDDCWAGYVKKDDGTIKTILVETVDLITKQFTTYIITKDGSKGKRKQYYQPNELLNSKAILTELIKNFVN